MTGLVFLLIALGFSVAGSLVLWMRHRRPGSMENAVAEFGREMRALSPERLGDAGASSDDRDR